MAKCDYCNKEMLECDGCDTNQLVLNDSKTYDRISVGDKYDFYEGMEYEELRCHDCNALIGNYHHAGCDCEVCPKCHQQLISCDC